MKTGSQCALAYAVLIFLSFWTTTPAAPAQQITLPLWTHGAPDPSSSKGKERDITVSSDPLIADRKIIKLTDVSEPTLTVYKAPSTKNSTPAIVVLPGGGYQILAYDLEGTEVCTWLQSVHVTCVLVKYRVPFEGHFPERSEDLEDAQQAMRLTRLHAAEWDIDPKRIGVLGFSAGGHLAAVLSNHFDFIPKSSPLNEHGGADPSISARPGFALLIYPAYLIDWPERTKLAPEVVPSASTPPTFLLQAEDDQIHVENALSYYQGLKDASVPAELHLYAQGGHGYGLRPTEMPVTHWPALAETWLKTIHVLDRQ